MSDEKNDGSFFLGIILGGVIGGIIIFILGTKEGKKLLEKVIDHVENPGDDLEKEIGKLESKGRQFLKDASDISKKIKTGNETISQIISSKIDSALKRGENIRNRDIKPVNEVKPRRTFKKNGKKLST